MPSPSSRSKKRSNSSSNSSNNMWNSSSSRSKKRGGSSSSGSGNISSAATRGGLATVDKDAAEKIFADIADEDDPSVAGMEGISTFCEKLEIDPIEDIRILVLLWKMGASRDKPAQISKQEWLSGCQKLQVDSVEKFKALLPSLDVGFLDRVEFRDFYKVRINYCMSLTFGT